MVSDSSVPDISSRCDAPVDLNSRVPSISLLCFHWISSPTLSFVIKRVGLWLGAFAKSQPLSPKVPEEEPDLLGQISIRVVGISCVPPPEKTAERESQSESQPKLQPKSQHESHPESQSETVKANAEPVEATSTANGDKRKHKQLLSLQENSEDSRPFSVFEQGSFHLKPLIESGVGVHFHTDS